MSDLEELERQRGNSEFVDTTSSLGGVQNFRARTASIKNLQGRSIRMDVKTIDLEKNSMTSKYKKLTMEPNQNAQDTTAV